MPMDATTILFLSKLSTSAAKKGVLAVCLHQSPNATPEMVSPPLPAACADAVKLASRPQSAEVRALVERHLSYLRVISTGPHAVASRGVARLAARAWLDVSDATGNAMSVPAAATGPDGQVMYVWDKGRHHLELEIAPDCSAEFFYRDREGSELWGGEYRPGVAFDSELLAKLKLFS